MVACGQAPERPPAADAMPVATSDETASGLAEQPSGDDRCVGVEVTTEPLPVDVFAVIDRSGSMEEMTSSGVSRWSATKSAFRDFLDQAPAGMGFGLSLFPVPGDQTASCKTDHYRYAALPIADVASMARGALARLDAAPPQGQTPTAPALSAALELATSYGAMHPERSVVVVLATDGLPTTCAPTDAAALAALAREALEGPGHVRTLVVASGSDAKSSWSSTRKPTSRSS
jgi:Mg-chelatase subunit ChlD